MTATHALLCASEPASMRSIERQLNEWRTLLEDAADCALFTRATSFDTARAWLRDGTVDGAMLECMGGLCIAGGVARAMLWTRGRLTRVENLRPVTIAAAVPVVERLLDHNVAALVLEATPGEGVAIDAATPDELRREAVASGTCRDGCRGTLLTYEATQRDFLHLNRSTVRLDDGRDTWYASGFYWGETREVVTSRRTTSSRWLRARGTYVPNTAAPLHVAFYASDAHGRALRAPSKFSALVDERTGREIWRAWRSDAPACAVSSSAFHETVCEGALAPIGYAWGALMTRLLGDTYGGCVASDAYPFPSVYPCTAREPDVCNDACDTATAFGTCGFLLDNASVPLLGTLPWMRGIVTTR